MQKLQMILLVMMIAIPSASWSKTDVMTVQAQGLQLGMNLDQANLETGHILVEDLPSRTQNYLVYHPDSRTNLDYDLTTWFTNTDVPRLYQLTLNRRFEAFLESTVLIEAYRKKFGEYNDFCTLDFGNKELIIYIWGGEILSCSSSQPISISTDAFIQVEISRENLNSNPITNVSLTLRNGDLLNDTLMIAEEIQKIDAITLSNTLLAETDINSSLNNKPSLPSSIQIPTEKTVSESEKYKSAPITASKHENINTTQKTSTEQTNGMRYVVQTGSYRDPQAAKLVADKYHKKGTPVSIAKLFDSKNREWHVVQAGIFKERKMAKQAANQFFKIHGIKCLIKHLPADLLVERTYYKTNDDISYASANSYKILALADRDIFADIHPKLKQTIQKNTDTNKEKIYVVQIGAFKSWSKALIQQTKYREKGYPASSITLFNSQKIPWYTVIIGLYSDYKQASACATSFSENEQHADFFINPLKQSLIVERININNNSIVATKRNTIFHTKNSNFTPNFSVVSSVIHPCPNYNDPGSLYPAKFSNHSPTMSGNLTRGHFYKNISGASGICSRQEPWFSCSDPQFSWSFSHYCNKLADLLPI